MQKITIVFLILAAAGCVNAVHSVAPDNESAFRPTVRQTGSWANCNGVAGVCINTAAYSCSVGPLTGKCPGGASIRCCPKPGGIHASACGTGLCMRAGDCPRSTLTGKCPGPFGITCCPKTTTQPPV